MIKTATDICVKDDLTIREINSFCNTNKKFIKVKIYGNYGYEYKFIDK